MGPQVSRERVREAEAEAARYAQRHPDDAEADRRDSDGGIRHLLERFRRLFRDRS
jgi:hypothetical protein